MDIRDFILITTAVLDFLLGLVVLLRNKRSEVNISFALFNFSLASWALGIALFRMAPDAASAIIWAKMYYIAASFIAVSLLYFASIFPDGKGLQLYKRFFIIFILLIHTALLCIPGYLTHEVLITSWGKEVVLGKIEYFIYTLYFLPFCYGALYLLHKKYRKSEGRVKNQIKFITSSIFLASIFGVFFNLMLPWLGNYRYIFLGPPFTIIIVWLIAYAIIRHRLWDFRLVFARAIMYSAMLLGIGILYVLASFSIGFTLFGIPYSLAGLVFYSSIAFFVAFTFEPLKRAMKDMTDKLFYKGAYTQQSLLKSISVIMSTTIDLDNLTSLVLEKITKDMKITRGAFVLLDEKERKYIDYLQTRGYSHAPFFNGTDIRTFLSLQKIIVFDDLEESDMKRLMRDIGAAIAMQLVVQDQKIGLLFLGEKASGDAYSQQDMEVFEILVEELSVAIHNSQEYEEIKRFNITLEEEVKHATKDLQDANVKLQELDKLKDEFVSIASHELRTPMTAIRSYLWMALDGRGGELTEKQRFYLDRAYKSTNHLINLVNDLLNISRIESGRLTVELGSVNLESLVQEVIDEVMPRAGEMGVNVTFNAPSEHLPEVLADGSKVKEVLFNLIGNSLKFTPKGGTVTIAFVRRAGMIETHVSDTGAGIARDDLQKLFQKFAMLPDSYSSIQPGQSGTGLGLYICKSIIELHEGKIWAESEGHGKGSTFAFSLHVLQPSDLTKISKDANTNPSLGLTHSAL